jgi:hypothetical protein
VLAGKVPDLTSSTGAVPILYLPGLGRPTVRATDEYPPELRPLAELQDRGLFWSQQNGKDWTVSASLESEKGGWTPIELADRGDRVGSGPGPVILFGLGHGPARPGSRGRPAGAAARGGIRRSVAGPSRLGRGKRSGPDNRPRIEPGA